MEDVDISWNRLPLWRTTVTSCHQVFSFRTHGDNSELMFVFIRCIVLNDCIESLISLHFTSSWFYSSINLTSFTKPPLPNLHPFTISTWSPFPFTRSIGSTDGKHYVIIAFTSFTSSTFFTDSFSSAHHLPVLLLLLLYFPVHILGRFGKKKKKKFSLLSFFNDHWFYWVNRNVLLQMLQRSTPTYSIGYTQQIRQNNWSLIFLVLLIRLTLIIPLMPFILLVFFF